MTRGKKIRHFLGKKACTLLTYFYISEIHFLLQIIVLKVMSRSSKLSFIVKPLPFALLPMLELLPRMMLVLVS